MAWPGNGRLNQSRNCAVESTWSSCLPFGDTVISCRYSASHGAVSGMRTKPFSIQPDDIASTALYLASDESRMVTGPSPAGRQRGDHLVTKFRPIRCRWQPPALHADISQNGLTREK